MKNLIVDTAELRKFIEWLPPIKPTEAYMTILMIRSRGLKEKYGFKGSDHALMFKAAHGYLFQQDPTNKWELWRTRLYENILMMGLLGAQGEWIYVKYKPGTTEVEDVIRVPPELLAIYVQINPSDVLKAITDAMKDVIESLSLLAKTHVETAEEHARVLRETLRRPDLRYYAGLARRRRTIFHNVDVDSMELAKMIEEEFHNTFGFIPARIRTVRGVHFLVNIERLQEKGMIKKWVGPPLPVEARRAMGEYKKRCIQNRDTSVCRTLEDTLWRYVEGRYPLYRKIELLSILYVADSGAPLVEIKKQSLEPPPGMLYRGTAVVRFNPEE